MGRADHIERLAAWIQRLADKGHIDYDDGIEVAALLRDTRPRFAGGARSQEDGDVTVLGPEVFASADGAVICWKGENYYREDRCAPLVEALENIADEVGTSTRAYHIARAALAAHREREGG